ncbi:protein of unknown function [Pararobbsia alpina]
MDGRVCCNARTSRSRCMARLRPRADAGHRSPRPRTHRTQAAEQPVRKLATLSCLRGDACVERRRAGSGRRTRRLTTRELRPGLSIHDTFARYTYVYCSATPPFLSFPPNASRSAPVRSVEPRTLCRPFDSRTRIKDTIAGLSVGSARLR